MDLKYAQEVKPIEKLSSPELQALEAKSNLKRPESIKALLVP